MPSPTAASRVLALLLLAAAPPVARAQDPLAAGIARWRDFLASTNGPNESLAAMRGGAERELGTAQRALDQGRRLASLYRLTLVQGNLGAVAFQISEGGGKPADEALMDRAFEALGKELAPHLGASKPADFAELRPAAVRALAEAAAPHVRGYYFASRDYGRATFPDAGLLYLGSARAERDLVAFVRTLREPAAGDDVAPRPLTDEIAALGREMLAAYRPPLSLDRHQEFVAAHGALDEARDLDAAGLRHGALLRYLQAAIRFAPLQATATPPTREQLIEQLAAAQPPAGDARDHSVARMLIELAEVELSTKAPGEATPAALAIATAALPRYWQAMSPATSPAPPPATPELTVTLVRWPYA
jgi:hypothetical protein